MKELLIALIGLVALTGCNQQRDVEQAAPTVNSKAETTSEAIKNLGVSYNQIIDKIAIPMKQQTRDDGGDAMAGHVAGEDGGFIAFYVKVDNKIVSFTRMILMPSSKGNSSSDEQNLRSMLQLINNTSPSWEDSEVWFKSAMEYSAKNPNEEVTKIYMGKDYTVTYAPELFSFELSVKPHN
jgi:hypothetical protein